MIRTSTIAVAAAALLASAGASLAAPPSQLYNKAISISFSVTANAVADDGTTTSRPRQVQRTFYISTKGRIFSRADRQVGRYGQTVERAPEQTAANFRFEGNRMIGVLPLQSGASQLSITFDSGFQSCTAAVIFGRESGKAFKFKGLDGKNYTATGVPTASAPSCSIRDGNPFAQ
jgi:hypothetical protein